MKRYLLILLLFIPVVSRPCGGDGYYYPFYQLISQTSIAQPAYHPFLRDDSMFYDAYGDDVGKEGNIRLWQEVLKGWDYEKISEVIYGSGLQAASHIWEGKNSKVEQASKTYVAFAHKCSEAFSYRTSYSWEYDHLKTEHLANAQALLEEADALYKREKNKQLKLRYAYQIVRILHYSRRNEEAIAFFETNVNDQFEKNEIYYYTVDQVAGCYYNIEDYDKAAYLYLTVFDKSKDRKKQAFLSYKFCTNTEITPNDGRSYLENLDDQCAYTLMKALRAFSDQGKGLEELYQLNPTDKRLELLFMRRMHELEDPILTAYNDSEKYKKLDDWNNSSAELAKFAVKMYSNPKTEHKEFWHLSSSYCQFLAGNLEQAKNELARLKGQEFQNEKAILERVYKVFSWDKMDVERENYIADTYCTKDSSEMSDYRFIIDHTECLYQVNGEIAKAFLVHNDAEVMVYRADMELMNQLLTFLEAPKKSKYETILANNAGGKLEESIALLYNIKAHYYLQAGQPKKALPLLKDKGSQSKFGTRSGFRGPVSSKIFSNNTIECFHCEVEKVMVDSVYLASAFNFIKPSFTRAELAEYLVKLDSIVATDTGWKGKLANYLLGNFYFNASNTGYYRHILTGYFDNIGSYIFEYAPYYMELGKEDDPKSIADISIQYYRNVIDLSNDRELNARCLYMIAKCELNNYYNTSDSFDGNYDYSSSYGYNGGVKGNAIKYKKGFWELKNNYKDTEFYNQIIKECSFFRYYCSL